MAVPFFQDDDLPQQLSKLIRSLCKSLLPDKVVIEIQQCKDPSSLIDIIKRNDDLFDTFHHDANGRAPRGIIKSITKSSFPQPRRATFSAYLSVPSYFPSLGSYVQQFFSSGNGYRPAADGRCRVVTPVLQNVFIHCWSAVWHHLSPASRKMPPTHVQVLLYLD